jgi:hypothetical protein
MNEEMHLRNVARNLEGTSTTANFDAAMKQFYSPGVMSLVPTGMNNLLEKEKKSQYLSTLEKEMMSAKERIEKQGAQPYYVAMAPERAKDLDWHLTPKPWKAKTILEMAVQEVELGCALNQAFEQAEKKLESIWK